MRIIILSLYFILNISAYAQFEYSSTINKVHQQILNLNFNASSTAIDNATKQDNGFWHLLEAQQAFLNYLTCDNNFDKAISICNISSNKLESNYTKKAYYHYCLADIYLYKSYLYFDNSYYINALNYFRKANKQIQTLIKESPEFSPKLKHQFILSFMDNYISQYLGASVNWNEEINKYISKIECCSDELIKRELKIIAPLLIYSYLNEKDVKFSWLNLNFAKKGALETFCFVFSMNKNNHFSMAYEALNYANQNNFNSRFNYLNLLFGNALANNQDNQSLKILTAFISNNKNLKGTKYALLKQLWQAYINDNKNQYSNFKKQFNTIPQSNFYLDQQAEYEYKNSNNWLPELLKARTLFDAGRYQESNAILLSYKDSVHNYNQSQRLEYTYRLARSYHLLQHTETAVKFYKIVINSQLESEFYYASYASYYCGNIFKEKGNITKAKKYYQYGLSLKSPIYEKSIHNKCKSALKQIQNQ